MPHLGNSTRSGEKESTVASNMQAVKPRWCRMNLSGSARTVGFWRKIGHAGQTPGRIIRIQMTTLERRSFSMKGTRTDAERGRGMSIVLMEYSEPEKTHCRRIGL